MLIKFLSFIASVLSNARYKAVLIPSIIVVLGISSLTTILMLNETRPPADATAQADIQPREISEAQATTQSSAEQQQRPKDDSQQIADTTTNTSQSSVSTDQRKSEPNTASGSTTPKPPFDITLNKAAATVSRDNLSTTFVASSNDASLVSWTIAPIISSSGEPQNIEIMSDNLKDPLATINFHLRATPTTPAGQYSFIITAKDSKRSINSSKTVMITVSQ